MSAVSSLAAGVAISLEGTNFTLVAVVALIALLALVVALVLEFTGFSNRLAPDEATYGGAGWRTALYWMDEVSLPDWRMFSKQPLGYFYINAAFFYVFGHTEIPLKLVNALLGALTGRYVYLIARDLFGSSVAARSAQFAAFFVEDLLGAGVPEIARTAAG